MTTYRKAGMAVFLAAVLASPLAQAQGLTGAAARAMRVAGTDYSDCLTKIYGDPAYASLQSRVSLRPGEATLQQLMSTDKVTDAEIAALSDRHDKSLICRTHYFNALNAAAPSFATILMQEQTKADKAMIDLIQRKISWGEFASTLRDIVVENRVAFDEESKRLAALQAQLQATGQSQPTINVQNTPAPVPTSVITPPRTCRTVLVGSVAQTQCY